MWENNCNELGYVLKLEKMLRDALESGLLISRRDDNIIRVVLSFSVSFECGEPQWSRAREILGKAAFAKVTPDYEAESKYAQISTVSAGLPLALGIAGRGESVDYEYSGYGEGNMMHRLRSKLTGTGCRKVT